MSEKDRLRLKDILEDIETIIQYTNEIDEDLFMKNSMISDSVNMRLISLGETCANLSDMVKAASPNVTWHKIIGLRNRLAHAYRKTDLAAIWEVVKNDLQHLKLEVIKLQDLR